MKAISLSVAALVLVSLGVWADDAQKPSVADLSKQATERARNFQVPKVKAPTLTDDQRKAMEAAADGARNRAKDELNRLAEQHPFTPGSPTGSPPSSDNPAVASATADVKGRVVVALSSSMPANELREYMAQLDGKREALVVLRGFVGGAKTVKPTGKFLEPLMRVSPTDGLTGKHRKVQVVVDPLLYRALKIDRVPAVVWLPGVTDVSHCEDKVFEASVTVYGTSSVSYALKQINRNGGAVPADIIKSFGG